MKNIKFLTLIILQVFFVQMTVAQSAETLDNGRAIGTVGTTVEETPQDASNVLATPTEDDADIPGSYLGNTRSSSEWVLPADLDAMSDELATNLDADEMTTKINEMEEQIKKLALYNEQLRLENKTIIKSLNSCCAGAGMNAEDAYLLQNSPNPFKETSQINFFVPTSVKKARLEIRDVDGEMISSHEISPAGFGHIEMKGQSLPNGTYVYALFIEDEIVDSKVMILTK